MGNMSIAPARPPRTCVPDTLNRDKPSGEPRASSPLTRYFETEDGDRSLDITQRLERKLAQLNASNNVFKRWIYEIITWTISALCMGGIIFILLYLSNRSLNKWPVGLTIFTVLTKIASAALILPTSEALGQLKWSWFNGKKSKEIWDFEIFDKASRGAWGSILLLFRTKGRSLAALGAILTVLLIANDTFFQQVVDLPERWVLQGSPSSIAKLQWYNSENSEETRGGYATIQNEQSLRPTALNFFYSNGTQPNVIGNGTSPQIPVSCPTSNCTWPAYESLGVCSKCVSITQLLTFACTSTKADWIGNITGSLLYDEIPEVSVCGYFLNASDLSPVLLSGYSTSTVNFDHGTAPIGEALLMRNLPLITLSRERLFNGSINFRDIRNSLANIIITSAANGAESVYRNETPIAQECVLYFCVKRLRSSYYWATYEEEVISTFTNSTPGTFPWRAYKVESAQVNGTDVYYDEDIIIKPVESGSGTYGMSRDTYANIYNIFDDIFPSFVTVDNKTAEHTFRNRVVVKGGPIHRRLSFNPWMAPNNVTHHLDRLATAFTNALRSTASREMVYGTAFSMETYVHVQWEWLIFPFALLILTLVFLVATMIKTAKGSGEEDPGIWKTSAMPTLIYGLPSPMQKQFTSSSTWSSGPDKSKNLKVRLHPKRGWRVSGQPCTPDTPVIAMRVDQAPPGWI
ncbi:hypothetical protein K458DRAFT_140294 [Lentithecium fluviatile CBS 122367]|uniref:DUF3176 domain containing protein n=1 Tax=Lentithecium fluviatile CBS 122367 TaxID=1168545 RepID=A0A6G1IJI1_9PLEO|nr:hypothetical protein K458DRAFT_140294 [Lentithecium fluviatile CBS 122367]